MATRLLAALSAALLLVSPNLWAQSQSTADPPGRVGRLSAIEGTVQQRTPDDNDWVQANLNYPVTTGFAIAPQDGARAEIQVGSMALRVGPVSELDVGNLGDHDASLTLAQGELNVRVGRLANGDRIELVTPRGVLQILAAGQYHIDAGTTESPTRFEVFNGRAEVQRDGGNTALASGQGALINPDNSLTMARAEPDPLDQWAFDRDRGPARAPNRTARAAPPAPYPAPGAPYAASGAPYAPAESSYVSPEMTGGADLADYGNWNTDSQYGSIWYPSGVPAGWAPYTYGRWSWASPWGWTWIDDEPWGFAPFHYGRWAYTATGWGWIPGAYVETVPVYSPALVVFFGGGPFYYDGFHAGIGWCPLGPGELFVPGYSVSVAYVRNVNITNVNINQFNITRVNNTIVINNDPHWGGQVSNFANHRFATVVPAAQFGQSNQRVRNIAVHSSAVTTTAATLPISRAPAVTPPHTVAGTNIGNRAAQFNRANRPPIPQAGTASATRTQTQTHQPTGSAPTTTAPAHTIAGHTLPALPPARGPAGNNARDNRAGAGVATTTTGSTASGRFGTNTRTPTTNAGRNLPPAPSTQTVTPSGNHAGNVTPQGGLNGNTASTARSARGPFGTTRPATLAPSATTSSAGHALPPLPTTRQSQVKPPAPQTHIAQPPTTPTGSSGSHRAFSAPVTPQTQHSVAAPAHTFTPPPQSQHSVTPQTRSFTPPPQPQHNVTPQARSFTPPQQPQHNVTPQTRNFTPPPQPQHNVTPQARSFTPPQHQQPVAPANNVAAPAHVAPPAAPARPVGNAAASHNAAPHAQPAAPPANNNQKRNNTNNNN